MAALTDVVVLLMVTEYDVQLVSPAHEISTDELRPPMLPPGPRPDELDAV